MAVNYIHITTREEFFSAIEEIDNYISDPLWTLGGTLPIIALDCETTGEKLYKKKVPLPICYEEDVPTGLARLLQIGLNPVYNPKRPVVNRQFVFDLFYLDMDLLKEYLTPILNSVNIVGHNIKYDYQFLFMQLGISLEHMVDTMLIGKVLLAGDDISHGLGEAYKRFLDFTWFIEENKCEEYPEGLNFKDYLQVKEEMQESDWSGELTEKQIKYSADDVYFPFFVLDQEQEWLRDYINTHESDSRPKQRISNIINLEDALIEVYAQAELRGVPFSSEDQAKVLVVTG